MAFFGAIRFKDSPDLDSFARLRVSNALSLFDSKQIHDNQPLFWDEALESGAGIASAHSADTASTVITSTLNTAGKFTRQTFMRYNYYPGKSQVILMTGVLARSGGGTGVQRRIGLFDDKNGLFFEDDEGIITVVRRTFVTGSAVDNKTTQSNWNLDTLDGNGASGVTADFSKAQIFIIDFEWLGTGRVRIGVVIAGVIIYVHQLLNANVLDTVYMSTPNLPLRIQMITTGSSPASTMENVCAGVMTEAGFVDVGVMRYTSTAGVHVDAATENIIYAIVGIRLKAAFPGSIVTLISVSLAEHIGSQNMEWMIIFNGTVAGPPTWADETNSAIQTFQGATANTVTGGTIIAGGYFDSDKKGGAAGAELQNALRLGLAIDGTVDEIVLAVRPIGGSSNIDVEGSLSWREIP
jgi:hypothetical protein